MAREEHAVEADAAKFKKVYVEVVEKARHSETNETYVGRSNSAD